MVAGALKKFLFGPAGLFHECEISPSGIFGVGCQPGNLAEIHNSAAEHFCLGG